MSNYEVVESATITQSAEATTGKRWTALLIKAGWGSKAYYTEEALKTDGPSVFKAGTPIFLDHQTPSDRELRPFGSVSNLAGELATDAHWDEEQQGLVAEVEIFEHEQARVRSLAKKVGLSIRAMTTSDRGTMEGRSGRIVTGLVGARSVDLVVRAGAGGQLLEVLESDIDEEMEEQQMNEVLEAIKKLSEDNEARNNALDTRLTAIEESLTAEAEVVEPATVVEPAVIETVDIKETLTELIQAEFAKLQLPVQESAEHEGNEEDVESVEESATETITTPRHWAVKGDK